MYTGLHPPLDQFLNEDLTMGCVPTIACLVSIIAGHTQLKVCCGVTITV